MKKIVFIFSFVFSLLTVFADEVDPFWTTVMAGGNLSDPVVWNKHIYTITEDRALNCISTKGSFVWRRNTKDYGKFITVANSGMIFVVTRKGTLETFSSQGMPIWDFDLGGQALFPAYSSSDGNIFILRKDKVFCFNQQGTLKWQKQLPAEPVMNITETGKAEIILVLKNKDFLRLSKFGHVNENKRLKKTIVALAPAPNGYLMSCDDKTLAYFKTTDGSQSVWQTDEAGVCKALKYKNGKFLAVFQDGVMAMRNIADNSEIWNVSIQNSFNSDVCCYSNKNEYYITSHGFGALITDSGELRWHHSIEENAYLPVITENGMLVGINGKVMNAYRMEAKLTRNKVQPLVAKEDTGINYELPFTVLFPDDSMGFFNQVKKDIESGNVGTKEPEYAGTLIRIIDNNAKFSYFPQNFTSFERAEAAALLGRLGSYEYREYLLEAVQSQPDSVFAEGILRGLGFIAYDPDGRTIDGIQTIISTANSQDDLLMVSACVALENLVKFGDEYTAKRAVLVLFSIINGRYSNNIKNFARQIVKNIVQ